jgi:uncharacterized protein involved in response to NO
MAETDRKAGERSGIPRYRATSLPALFTQGFRPFFLVAALSAPLLIILWMLMLSGLIVLPTTFEGAAWHAHEMIFGFAVAAMAGFLMTAIPNWTGRMPLQGFPLLLLTLVWLLGRFAVAFSASTGSLPAAIADLAFLALLILVMGREIVAGANWRNLPMVVALAILMVANAASHLAAAGLVNGGDAAYRAGLALFATLIALIGGKIIPSFTGNALAKMGRPRLPQTGRIDALALVLTPLALIAWIFESAIPTQEHLIGALLVAAGVLGAFRLARWRGHSIHADILLLALHAGFAWLCIGLVLLGLSRLLPEEVPELAGLHAIGAGAMATMILPVMARTTLAHTRRRAVASLAMAIMCFSANAAAVLRVLAVLIQGASQELMMLSAGAWLLAFGLFLFDPGRWLLAPSATRWQSG